MGPQTISEPGLAPGRPRNAVSRGRRLLLVAAGVSVAVHIAAALLVVLLPRVLPREVVPVEPGTVELLMVEQKGAAPSQEGAQAERPSVPPRPPVEAPKQEAQQSEPPQAVVVPAPPPENADEAAPPPVVPTPPQRAEAKPDAAKPVEAKSTETKPAEATSPQDTAKAAAAGPVFDLAGTESESNASVLGAGVVPASPDNRFRNRPPIFPHDAELRGEHGTVVVVIHVSDTGAASSVDVMESSGVESLDRAAIDAVRKWHFRPAMQEGRSVPFDMPFRFIFQAY